MAAAGAVASVAVGYMQAKSSEKTAKRAQQSQDSANAADLAFRQEQYDKWVNDYETPLVKPLIQKSAGEGPLNLGPAWANTQSNFDASGRNLEAAYARSGMTGSGLNKSGFATLESGRASALGDAFQKGLQNRDALRVTLANFGKQTPGAATNLQQGFTNQANIAGQRASQAAGSAADSWGAVGSGLSTLGQAWGQYGGKGMWGLGGSTASTPTTAESIPATQTLQQARNLENPNYGQTVSPTTVPTNYGASWGGPVATPQQKLPAYPGYTYDWTK